MEPIFDFEIAAILISMIQIFYFGRAKKASNFQNIVFMLLIICNLLSGLFHLTNYIVSSEAVAGPVGLRFFLISGYYITHLLVVPLISLYIISTIKQWGEFTNLLKAFVIVPVSFGLLLILLNPFTNFVFSFSDGGDYKREFGLYILYGIAAFYLVIFLLMLLRYREKYSTVRIYTLFMSFFIIVCGMLIQIFVSELKLEVFAIAFSCLFVMFLLQDPKDQVDAETGLYNKLAFKTIMTQNIASGKYFDVIEIVLTDYDEVSKHFRFRKGESIAREVGFFLKSLQEDVKVYRIGNNVFCMEINQTEEEEIEQIIQLIKERFKKPWSYLDYELFYRIKICHIALPEMVDSMSKLMGMVKGFVNQKTDKIIVSMEDFNLDQMEREMKITNSLIKAVEENKFEIVYSPIYSVKEGKIKAVDASARYFDEELGYIYEEEIFDFAEKSGQVARLSEDLFEQFCIFLKKHDLKQYGIDYVGVKFNKAPGVQFAVMKNYIEKAKNHGIPLDLFAFEVSEQVIAEEAHITKEGMEELLKEGVHIGVYDYGSGYSSLACIYELPLDMLKLSSNLVKAALENDKAEITLESTLELARSLKMRTVIDGITDKKEFDLISGLPCDYAKGTFFYKEIEEVQLLQLLQEQNGSLKGGGMS